VGEIQLSQFWASGVIFPSKAGIHPIASEELRADNNEDRMVAKPGANDALIDLAEK
jgi:hypothetical protein